MTEKLNRRPSCSTRTERRDLLHLPLRASLQHVQSRPRREGHLPQPRLREYRFPMEVRLGEQDGGGPGKIALTFIIQPFWCKCWWDPTIRHHGSGNSARGSLFFYPRLSVASHISSINELPHEHKDASVERIFRL